MSSLLIDSLATTDALSALFSDASVLQAFLDVEVALAAAEAQGGAIPQRAADAIRDAARADRFDPAAIARAARESGTLTIPLVKALTAQVEQIHPASSRFVHFGATSQDIADTALVLLLTRARPVLAADHDRLVRDLRALSDRHAQSVMLARTLLQPAPPITFGLKAAQWVSAVARSWARVARAFEEMAVVQFGGASGTLAALGSSALDIRKRLAAGLQLAEPPAPWHTERDRLAALVAALAIYTAALGKIARDISLLMQDEVGEAAEPGGSSSTMPHKRNPAGCAIVLAAAARMPGLTASLLTAMVQEHERGVGGWHAEWPIVASAVQTAGAAVAASAGVAAGLTVSPERMRANLERTNGAVFAERIVMLAAPAAGKEAAQALAAAALSRSRETGQRLDEVLKTLPEAATLLSSDQIESMAVPEAYLGAAETFRRKLLAEA
ncbi:MAG TPA: 3-carboxy-cis,cis-muconate cycloisomerase [Vicinamibacterales bacterium]|nr:3-carboxy-cis,cis-muconate cycloisomerase [Vicinamibacterales bacterium]